MSAGDKRRETTFDPSASAHEFREGLARHQQGNLVAAERHYNAALKNQPDNFDALHMLGVIALQKGRIDEGVKSFEEAAHNALYRTPEAAYTNAGVCLRGAKPRRTGPPRNFRVQKRELTASHEMSPAVVETSEHLPM